MHEERTGFQSTSHAGGILLAALCSGPLLLTSATLGTVYLQLPNPLDIKLEAAATFLLGLVYSLVPGMTVGLLVNALGTIFMMGLSTRFSWARSSLSWACAGALCGASFACLFSETQGTSGLQFGLVLTSAACGWLCQFQVDWSRVA